MKSQNKNKYLLFLFSLLPGAAEMYMGLMHMGASLMAAFFASCALFVFFYQFEGLIFVPALLWFYGFFHARNLISCPDEEFDKQEDKFIWEELFPTLTLNKHVLTWSGASFILMGLDAILNSASEDGYFGDYYNDTATNILGAIMVIILGVYLIRQAKKHVKK